MGARKLPLSCGGLAIPRKQKAAGIHALRLAELFKNGLSINTPPGEHS